jgi:nicotinamide mononucleotide adenylyltransferase
MENKNNYLLTEASNHINHLYDNPQLTFKKIKEILNAAANGQLEGTEKVDGIRLLLSFSVYDNKAKGARNKQDIKDGGRTANQLYKDFADHYNPNLKRIFLDAMASFERMIQGLDVSTQIELFGEDTNIYYISDIISPTFDEDGEPLNVINYDTKNIVIHEKGHNQYDRTTGEPVKKDISDKIDKLRQIILRHQEDLKHENFGVQINAIKRLKALNNKIPLNASINRINSLITLTNSSIKDNLLKLNDESTINDYMIARIYILLNSILSKAPQGVEAVTLKTKINIAKKIFGISGISVYDLRRNLSKDQFLFIKEKILDNRKNILKTAIQPLEITISDFTVEMLKNLQSAYIVDDNKEVNRLKIKVKKAIKEIEKSGSQQDLINLKRQIQKLKNLDRVSTSAEGFVFDYDGVTYKFTGNFAPINQIMNLFKKINKEKNFEAESQKNISEEEEPKEKRKIVLLAGSFKPPHKGHLEMVKEFLNLERPSKIVILVSKLSRDEVTSFHSLNIWDMYLAKNNLKGIVEVLESNFETPIKSAFEFMSNEDDNPEFAQDGDLIILGFSTKNNESQLTVDNIDKSRLKKKIDIKIVPIEPKFNNLSSTDMREAIRQNNIKSLINFIPDEFELKKQEAAKQIINTIKGENNLAEQQISDIIKLILNETIIKKGKKYCLISKKTHRNLGCYRSRSGAEKREKQVQFFKHKK